MLYFIFTMKRDKDFLNGRGVYSVFARFVFTAMISALVIIGFPGYSLAQGEHSGHGPAPAHSVQENRRTDNLDRKSPVPGSPAPADRPARSDGGGGGQALSQPGSGDHEAGGQALSQPGHGGDSGYHQGSGASGLDPVRNTLLGGFAAFNALVIAVAAILKKKALKGGAE